MTRGELEALLASIPDPLGVLVDTNVPFPWRERDGLPRITGVRISGRQDGVLKEWEIWLEGSDLRPVVWEALATRPVFTWSAPETMVTVERCCGRPVWVLGDVLLASRMAQRPCPDVRPPLYGALQMYVEAESLYRAIAPQRVTYELEKQVAGWLYQMTAVGYQQGEQRLHPIWTTLHESGSGRIVARSPSLSNVRRDQRGTFQADPFKRWVCIAWPHADLTMMALLSEDPALGALAQSEDPYSILADLWGTSPDRARQILYALVNYGPRDLPRLEEGLKEDAAPYASAFMAYAPEWAAWFDRLPLGEVVTWLGRRIVVKEAHKLHGAVIMESVATALKMLLALLRHEGAFRAEAEMAGLGSVIPLYDRVYYQVDVHVPVDRHVEVVRRVASLARVGANFRSEVLMGPTWGDLSRVDGEYGQVVADLKTPPHVPVACPVCKLVASDWPTLEWHLRDRHRWTEEQVGGLQ